MIGDSHSPTWRSSDTGGYAGEIRRAIMIRLLVVALPLSLSAGTLVLLCSAAAASLPVIASFATALVAVSLWGGHAAAAQLARALSVPADLLRETLSAGEGAGGKLPSAEAGRLDLKGLESEFASMTDAFARKAAIESATLTELARAREQAQTANLAKYQHGRAACRGRVWQDLVIQVVAVSLK